MRAESGNQSQRKMTMSVSDWARRADEDNYTKQQVNEMHLEKKGEWAMKRTPRRWEGEQEFTVADD